MTTALETLDRLYVIYRKEKFSFINLWRRNEITIWFNINVSNVSSHFCNWYIIKNPFKASFKQYYKLPSIFLNLKHLSLVKSHDLLHKTEVLTDWQTEVAEVHTPYSYNFRCTMTDIMELRPEGQDLTMQRFKVLFATWRIIGISFFMKRNSKLYSMYQVLAWTLPITLIFFNFCDIYDCFNDGKRLSISLRTAAPVFMVILVQIFIR